MKTFEYRGYRTSGGGVRGVVEAPDLKAAREILTQMGVLPEWIQAAQSLPSRSATGRLTMEQRALAYQELGVLVDAGVPLVQALSLVMQSPELEGLQGRLGGVRDRVREGSGLATALSDTLSIRDYEVALVEAGEKSGALGPILNQLAGFLHEQQALRDRIRSLLIYPMLVLSFALIMAIILLGFVIPSAARMISAETGMELPGLTRWMIGVGRVILWTVAILVPVALGSAIWGRRFFLQNPVAWTRWDRLSFRVPLAGHARRLVANLRFCRTLELLLRGGVPLLSSLELAGRSTGSAWIVELCRNGMESLRQGATLADVLRHIPPLSESLPGWVQTGEATGALERLMKTAGDHYQQRWNRSVTRWLSWLEPVLILIIGAFVLLVVLSVLLPVLELNRNLR